MYIYIEIGTEQQTVKIEIEIDGGKRMCDKCDGMNRCPKHLSHQFCFSWILFVLVAWRKPKGFGFCFAIPQITRSSG